MQLYIVVKRRNIYRVKTKKYLWQHTSLATHASASAHHTHNESCKATYSEMLNKPGGASFTSVELFSSSLVFQTRAMSRWRMVGLGGMTGSWTGSAFSSGILQWSRRLLWKFRRFSRISSWQGHSSLSTPFSRNFSIFRICKNWRRRWVSLFALSKQAWRSVKK